MNWGRLLCALVLVALCAGCEPKRITAHDERPAYRTVSLPIRATQSRFRAWGAAGITVAAGDSFCTDGFGVRVLDVDADHVTYRVTDWSAR